MFICIKITAFGFYELASLPSKLVTLSDGKLSPTDIGGSILNGKLRILGILPYDPPFTVDRKGNPLHSQTIGFYAWRVFSSF